jgi:hypothetical protein
MPLGQFLDNVNGPLAKGVNSFRTESGLKSVAFHPNFSNPGMPGYRKLYTSVQEVTALGASGLPYVGTTVTTDLSDSVVGEWTLGANGLVDFSSYREVLRVALNWYAHPAQALGFDPYANPGDEDYGLLYFSHGDAGTESDGTGQVGTTAHGKILRIDPLQNGASRYTIPSTNPFTSTNDPTNQVLDEVYAMGLRNPTSFSWANDAQGVSRMIVGDIGEWNAEEVNVVESGANFGWRDREGTFVNNATAQSKGIGFGIDYLPANDAELNDFTYPAAQYGHVGVDGTVGPPAAARGGYVIQNGSAPELQGQYIFGDFPESAKILTASLADLLSAKTKLADGESPTSLAPATVSDVGILFDDDDNPVTPSVAMSMRDVLIAGPGYDGSGRTDIVFGQGYEGELYILNKHNGWIYLATNTLPLESLPGDYNGNGVVDAADYTVWRNKLGQSISLVGEDPNATTPGYVDEEDYDFWRANFGNTAGGAALAAVPEPNIWMLSGSMFFCLAARSASYRRQLERQQLRRLRQSDHNS